MAGSIPIIPPAPPEKKDAAPVTTKCSSHEVIEQRISSLSEVLGTKMDALAGAMERQAAVVGESVAAMTSQVGRITALYENNMKETRELVATQRRDCGDKMSKLHLRIDNAEQNLANAVLEVERHGSHSRDADTRLANTLRAEFSSALKEQEAEVRKYLDREVGRAESGASRDARAIEKTLETVISSQAALSESVTRLSSRFDTWLKAVVVLWVVSTAGMAGTFAVGKAAGWWP